MERTIYIADIRSNSNKGMSTGHFIPVAKMYQKIFIDNNVIIAGGPIYKKYFNEKELLALPYNVSSTRFIDKIRTLKNCIKLFNTAKNQIIILQQSSTITALLGILLFYHSKSKLYLIQYNHDCLKSSIGKTLYKFTKHKINGIICPTLELGEIFNIPFCIVPDYIYTNENIKNVEKDYDNTIYDFCILGRIAPEKGVIECARRFANTKYKIIIAGKPETKELEDELKNICSHTSNIELIINYISNEQYKHYLEQSKYALLNYQSVYSERSSGVVFDMLFNNVPVIGTKCKTLQFIEEKNLGYLYSDLKTFNPDIILNKKVYNQYLNNIITYRDEHKTYISKLKQWIL